MKILIICVCISLVCFNANAQLGLLGKKPVKQVETLRERPLLVVLWDEGELDDFNENIKKALDLAWTFSTDIRYISKDEWKTIYKDKDEAKKYAHLYYTKKMLGGNAPDHSLLIGLVENKVSTHFAFTPHLGLADLIFSLKNIQIDLEIGNDYKNKMKEMGKNASKFLNDSLETKTVYFDEANVSKKFLKKIHDVYPFKYEIVSKEEIDDAILNKDSDILFFRQVVRAQRPLTKTRTDISGKTTAKTASMNVPVTFVYKASDLEIISGVGMGNDIGIKDVERFLSLMDY
ncbi:hypothetical protein [Psychroserpens jangbogonensis]|uniref:hypothetical protein n=1 Tax=Psychroserpens jangbogonensis TaxID=1484460 RepID=UPI00053E922F|nr:hypothetical protein [Psychroserpens jangbogonensis]